MTGNLLFSIFILVWNWEERSKSSIIFTLEKILMKRSKKTPNLVAPRRIFNKSLAQGWGARARGVSLLWHALWPYCAPGHELCRGIEFPVHNLRRRCSNDSTRGERVINPAGCELWASQGALALMRVKILWQTHNQHRRKPQCFASFKMHISKFFI